MPNLHELPHDEIERIFNAAPFIAHLGIRLVRVSAGYCETELVLAPQHLQQDGFVHAGVQATLADHTAGGAAGTLVSAGQIVLTAEFKINLLRAAKGERLICRATVLKPGTQLVVVESEVECVAEGAAKLVSKTTATVAIVQRRG